MDPDRQPVNKSKRERKQRQPRNSEKIKEIIRLSLQICNSEVEVIRTKQFILQDFPCGSVMLSQEAKKLIMTHIMVDIYTCTFMQ